MTPVVYSTAGVMRRAVCKAADQIEGPDDSTRATHAGIVPARRRLGPIVRHDVRTTSVPLACPSSDEAGRNGACRSW